MLGIVSQSCSPSDPDWVQLHASLYHNGNVNDIRTATVYLHRVNGAWVLVAPGAFHGGDLCGMKYVPDIPADFREQMPPCAQPTAVLP